MVRRAAMEPARNGRDDQAERLGVLPPVAAAMEPARNGRDDGHGGSMGRMEPSRPQWSPPVMGGMTSEPQYGTNEQLLPQWSPPVMGGMTRWKSGPPGKGDRAAMGAARSPRSSAPQWSPPVMGGMTSAPSTTISAPSGAAMEPARNGRDDGAQDREGLLVDGAAMEPARNGRDDHGGYRPGATRTCRRNGARP